MKKHKRKEFTFPALLSIGVGFALASLLAVTMLLAVISYFTADPTAYTGAFSLLSLVVAGAVSGFVTSRVNGEGGVLIGILSSVIASSTLLIAGLIISGGSCALCVLVNSLAFIGVSSLAAVLAKKIGKKSPKRRYTYG